jgi:putative oxidoreductase
MVTAVLRNYGERYSDYLFFVFRIMVGLLFVQHGVQKLFGWFGGIGGSSVELVSLFGLAGIIELLGGIAIIAGIFTRLAAFIGAVELLVAYFMVHVPQGLIPISNQGELALLYVAAFLVLVAYGAKKWSLEKVLLKKEVF